MTKLDPTVDQHLRAIEASCPRLLYALQATPEAVSGELMRMEAACKGLEKAGTGDLSVAVREIIALVAALRGQMAKDGLMDYEEFAAFRQGVSTLQRCLALWRNPKPDNELKPTAAAPRRDLKTETRGAPGPVPATRSGNGEARVQPNVADLPKNTRRLKTSIFYCSNNLDAAQLTGAWGDLRGDSVRMIGLPCSGKVDVPYLVKALETGADGVVVVTCKTKECRNFEGSLRAHKRAEAVESLLEEIGFSAGRMAVVECAAGGVQQACAEIKRFIEQVRKLPQVRTPGGVLTQQERMVA
jgi:F420-non-reducing hydrogenase iron-sulfur subunit